MKVVLVGINGSYSHTNLAIRCLRRALKNDGFEVSLLERNLRDKPSNVLQELVNDAKDASLVGFSVYIWNAQFIYDLASDFKKIRPDCIVVFGGPEVSYDTDRFENSSFVDSVIRGEGEEHIVTVAKAVRDGVEFKKVYDIKPVLSVMTDEGILYEEGDYPTGSIVYYESSRGCPYKCSYCLSSICTELKRKTEAQVYKDLKEFERLPDRIKIIKFVDRTFNFPVDRANNIWRELLKEEYTKNYHFEICANLLNEESFDVLSKFPKGKIQLEIGLQSTNEETLNSLSRHLNAQEILKNVERLHKMGNIHLHLDLIAGLPFESYERFKKSFDDSYGCSDMLQLGFLKLLRGTRMRDLANEYGYKYMDRPPYTVLSNNWIKYEEIAKLSDIADVLTRFYESCKFKNTLKLIMNKVTSPFAFYEGLSGFISETGKKIQQIGQKEAFKVLFDYAENLFDFGEKQLLLSALEKDYSAGEVGRFPSFLK